MPKQLRDAVTGKVIDLTNPVFRDSVTGRLVTPENPVFRDPVTGRICEGLRFRDPVTGRWVEEKDGLLVFHSPVNGSLITVEILPVCDYLRVVGQFITVPNTLARPLRSAILKGNTLVNLVPSTYYVDIQDITTAWSYSKFLYLPNNGLSNDIKALQSVKSNTKYLLRFYIEKNTVSGTFRINNPSGASIFSTLIGIEGGKTGWFNFVLTTEDITDKTIAIRIQNGNAINGDVKVNKIMLIEYVDGMENWNIPYFEGMQSVRMPVLTTMGVNIFEGETDRGYIDPSTGQNSSAWNDLRSVGYTEVIGGNTIKILVTNESFSNPKIYEYDENKNFIGIVKNNILSSHAKFVRFSIGGNTDVGGVSQVMLYYGDDIKREYEPYKTNILSIDGDYRGIGNICDTVNCITGEVVDSFTSVIFNGVETWTQGGSQSDGFVRFYSYVTNKHPNALVISKDIAFCNDVTYGNAGYENVSGRSNNTAINISLKMERLGITDLSDKTGNISKLKEWLTTNNIEVVYQRSEKNIKTVDLKGQKVYAYDGVTHYQATSQGGLTPMMELEVPVSKTALVLHERGC